MPRDPPNPLMTPTSRLLAGLVLLGSACADSAPALAPGIEMPLAAREQPNLLLISIDTLRADYLGCYGYGRETSPALDALAAAGTRFDDMVAASPWTLPSHATLLSGLYPSRHGAIDHNFELRAPTLGTLLQAAGYHTMAIVNTKNIGAEQFGLMRGYDQKHYELEFPLFTLPDGTQQASKRILNSGKQITKRALQWMDASPAEQPFFLFLHFYDVHTDFTPAAEWREAFVGAYTGDFDGTTLPLVKVRNGKKAIDGADIQWLKEMYAAEIRTMDAVLGEFFAQLVARGLDQNTVLAITSDHGEEFYEHGSVLHGRTYYEEQTRIPLILRGPGIPSGLTLTQPVHHIDVAPTLLALAGVQAPPMDGLDLSRAWYMGPGLDPARMLISEADHNNIVDGRDQSNIRRMLRLEDYKLIYDTVDGSKRLFDLGEDPLELRNLVDERPAEVDELFRRLEAFMQGSLPGHAIEGLSEADQAHMNALGYGGADDEEDEAHEEE